MNPLERDYACPLKEPAQSQPRKFAEVDERRFYLHLALMLVFAQLFAGLAALVLLVLPWR